MRGLTCRLLPVSEEHLPRIAQWLTGTDCEALLRGTSASLPQAAAYTGLEGDGRRAALVADARGRVVGLVHWWRLGEGVYEVGGATGDERLWRTGIGMEAAALLVDYLFEVLNCRRVEFTTGTHNTTTIDLGFSDDMFFEAICRDYFDTPNGPVAAVKSALTREEYYRPYPHYQPRVGRRLDSGRLEERNRALAKGLDARAIADRLLAER